MTFVHRKISLPFSKASDRYEVVVIGSGYGGGVAASRLARAGRNVAVLERGREIGPGEYPNTIGAAMDEFQVTLGQTGRKLGKRRDGLYDLRVGEDMNVLIGCGLGGTSLINANVALKVDPRVFDDWPSPFRQDRDLLKPYYDRARLMLGSKPYPEGKTPPKMKALQKVAEGLKAPFRRPDINVTFEDSLNSAGIWQAACTDCGDCVSGCNYGAKNTTLMNYLPDAKRHGAAIFTGAEVLSLRRDGQDWTLSVRDLAADDGAPPSELRAGIVVLAAGTLGTNEILLRSREAVSLSPQLGRHFSGNGDIWAFGYNANMPEGDGRAWVYGVGAGAHETSHGPVPEGEEKFRPGPCITGMVDLRDPKKPLSEGVVIEEGAMPGALAPLYAAGFPALEALLGDPFRFGDAANRLKDAQALGEKLQQDPLDFGETAYEGPVARTMPFLVMSHDASAGQLKLANDCVTVSWPDAGRDEAILKDASVIRKACDAIQAEYLPNPIWQDGFGNRLLTVHPLGGCSMADGPDTGVVNHKCQVFDPDGGGVHEGLYVVDGAAMPRGVGVNPHLTITAVAEYAVEQMATDRGWTIDWSGSTSEEQPLLTVEPAINPAAVLAGAIEGLRTVETAIDSRMYELARLMLTGLWRQLREAYKTYAPPAQRTFPLPDEDAFIRVMGDDSTLRDAVSPILGQMLDVLDALQEKLNAGDYPGLLDTAGEKLGDFSPPVQFPEEMSGHISALGFDDPAPAFDPFEVAGEGPVNCRLTATLRADAVASAIRPPDGMAEIVDGRLHTTDFGDFSFTGTFRFLQPDPDAIECWQMIYEGPLTGGRDGRDLTFRGYKTLQRREGSHWWRDLTELRVEIRDGNQPIARGMLRLGLEDAMAQGAALEIGYSNLLVDLVAVYNRIAEAVPDKKLTLPTIFQDRTFRTHVAKSLIYLAGKVKTDLEPDKAIAMAYKARVFARMAGLVLRTYGGVSSYLFNFPAKEAGSGIPPAKDLPEPVVYHPEPEPGIYLKLTRYEGGSKGPVILAGGFGTRASSFATSTVDENIVQTLTRDGFDVWLFDYRGSGDIEASLEPFTLDDVAQKDWPAAIRLVTERTGKKDVQALVHCIGSMTLFMAILAGESRVRSIIASQLGAHPITNWFNFAKGDSRSAEWIAHGVPERLLGVLKLMGLDGDLANLAKNGLATVDPRSPSVPDCPDTDPVVDGMVWNVPGFAPVSCYSPTCHRINAIFGPSYLHENLNQKTHNAIRHMFGPVSTAPFVHIARIFSEGRIVSADGKTDYLAHPERLSMPIHFIAGARNAEMLPEATLRTLEWLRRSRLGLRPRLSRHVYHEFGHMDCFIGKTAAQKIFKDLRRILNCPECPDNPDCPGGCPHRDGD